MTGAATRDAISKNGERLKHTVSSSKLLRPRSDESEARIRRSEAGRIIFFSRYARTNLIFEAHIKMVRAFRVVLQKWCN
jgi:hypothetical protein